MNTYHTTMKATTTEEKSKILAEFMGFKPRFVEYPNTQLNRWEIDKDNNWVPMRYHESYDWLMPVWYKFRDLYNIPKGSPGTLVPGVFYNKCNVVGHAIIYKPIAEAFDLLVEAVEWYNSINDKKE